MSHETRCATGGGVVSVTKRARKRGEVGSMGDLVKNLPDDLRSFIEFEVGTGRFATTDDVIETALRMLKERETRLAALRAVMAEADAQAKLRRRAPDSRPPGV